MLRAALLEQGRKPGNRNVRDMDYSSSAEHSVSEEAVGAVFPLVDGTGELCEGELVPALGKSDHLSVEYCVYRSTDTISITVPVSYRITVTISVASRVVSTPLGLSIYDTNVVSLKSST
ncbi:hypothetical protein H4Q26_014607 [Puccinia striiformis f. sp. tritici PST-130]|nr:hypothetical protein H4Q26_014607 [Puccinia striiformis f. sp. tritici PST-130]